MGGSMEVFIDLDCFLFLNGIVAHMACGVTINIAQTMKKRSSSSHGSDHSQERVPLKPNKKIVTFDYHQLDCFMSTPTTTTHRNLPPTANHSKLATLPPETLPTKKEEQGSPFSHLRVPRRNRGKILPCSQRAFNNSILLLEYENREDSTQKQKERRESPKSEEEDQEVSAVVKSCVRVITEDTEYSSNPVSAQYTPRSMTEASESATYFPFPSQMLDYNYYYAKQSGRNRRAISYEESNSYVVDVDKVEADGRTTVMVRNIPNKYTQDMLLRRIEGGHRRKFDFFYLPIDYNNNCNVGYAFVNFISAKFIRDFYLEFHGLRWEKFNSVKVCQVCYGRIQGTAQLERHFEHSNVIQQKDRRYRPLIGLKTVVEDIHTLVNKQKEGRQDDHTYN